MAAPRSLADDLRQREPESLGRLLRRRPDLLHPVPTDLTALTTRATTGPSIARCLDSLDALHLHVLRVATTLTAHDAASAEAIVGEAAETLGPDAIDDCMLALTDLVEAALIWGTPHQLRAVHAVRDQVAAVPVPRWPRATLRASEQHDLSDVDERAALSARAALAQVRDLLDDWSADPPSILRSGGLSLRDFASATRALHSDWRRASLTIEVAHAARLVADDHEESPHWVPTDHYDVWLSRPPAEQWIELVTAWLGLNRLASLADEKTQVLSTDRDRRAIPVLRRQVLDLLCAAPSGASLSLEQIIEILDDRQPRRAGDLRALTVDATLLEATELGLTGAGAMSTAGRLLLASLTGPPADRRLSAAEVATALNAALPDDIDHVLIQADLTIIAPGPLAASPSRTLRLLADVESRGHATVFRISEGSIRRALDAGWDAAAIHAVLADISSTPVPQPLTYLIDDTARRHGTVRVGNALGYIRCDNPETLSAAVADRRLRSLGLSRLADTVIISQSPAAELIEELRAAGYAPAAESPDGDIVIRRPEDRRTAAPRAGTVTTRRMTEDALVDAAVRSLLAGDRAATEQRGATVVGPASKVDLPSLSSAAILTALRTAIADNRPLWIGYADTDGSVTQQIVDPIRLAGGVLTAFDHRTEQVRSFSVARATGVAPLTTDETDG
ncbi:MAG: helicase-associated domain-containing protein [Actinobacteria bacterium]|nr:helicase-associated domain-containing protein [Actinomycetota bacterium]